MGGEVSVEVAPVTVYARVARAGERVAAADSKGKLFGSWSTDDEGKVVIEDFPSGGSVTLLTGEADDSSELASIFGVEPGDVLYPDGRSQAAAIVAELEHTVGAASGQGETQYRVLTCAGADYRSIPPFTVNRPLNERCLDENGNFAWFVGATDAGGDLVAYDFQKAVSPLPNPAISSTTIWQTALVDLELAFKNDSADPYNISFFSSSASGGVSYSAESKALVLAGNSTGSVSFAHPANFPDSFSLSWNGQEQTVLQRVAGPLPVGPTQYSAQTSDLMKKPDATYTLKNGVLTLNVDVSGRCWGDIKPNQLELFLYGETASKYTEWSVKAPPTAKVVFPELPPEFPADAWAPASFTEDFYVDIELRATSTVDDPTARPNGEPAFLLRLDEQLGKSCFAETSVAVK